MTACLGELDGPLGGYWELVVQGLTCGLACRNLTQMYYPSLVASLLLALGIAGSPASAQGDPRIREGAGKLNDAIDKTDSQTRGALGINTCLEMAIKNPGMASRELQRLDKSIAALGFVGKVLTAGRVATNAAAGRNADLAQDAFWVVVDQSVCAGVGMVVCPAWMVGRTIGELLNEAHRDLDANGRALNDVILDGAFIKYETWTEKSPAEWAKAEQDARERIRRIQRAMQAEQSCSKPNSMNAAAERLRRGERITEAAPVKASSPMPARASVSRPQSSPDDCKIFDNPVQAMALSESDPQRHEMLEKRCIK